MGLCSAKPAFPGVSSSGSLSHYPPADAAPEGTVHRMGFRLIAGVFMWTSYIPGPGKFLMKHSSTPYDGTRATRCINVLYTPHLILRMLLLPPFGRDPHHAPSSPHHHHRTAGPGLNF